MDRGTKPVLKHVVEERVLERVQAVILKVTHLENLVRLTNDQLEASLETLKVRLASLQTHNEDIDRRLDRLYDALETGNLDLDSPAPRIRDLNEERDLVQRARTEVEETLVEGRVELVSREVVLEYLLDFREALEYSSVVERRAFLRSFIRSMDLENS